MLSNKLVPDECQASPSMMRSSSHIFQPLILCSLPLTCNFCFVALDMCIGSIKSWQSQRAPIASLHLMILHGIICKAHFIIRMGATFQTSSVMAISVSTNRFAAPIDLAWDNMQSSFHHPNGCNISDIKREIEACKGLLPFTCELGTQSAADSARNR